MCHQNPVEQVEDKEAERKEHPEIKIWLDKWIVYWTEPHQFKDQLKLIPNMVQSFLGKIQTLSFSFANI